MVQTSVVKCNPYNACCRSSPLRQLCCCRQSDGPSLDLFSAAQEYDSEDALEAAILAAHAEADAQAWSDMDEDEEDQAGLEEEQLEQEAEDLAGADLDDLVLPADQLPPAQGPDSAQPQGHSQPQADLQGAFISGKQALHQQHQQQQKQEPQPQAQPGVSPPGWPQDSTAQQHSQQASSDGAGPGWTGEQCQQWWRWYYHSNPWQQAAWPAPEQARGTSAGPSTSAAAAAGPNNASHDPSTVTAYSQEAMAAAGAQHAAGQPGMGQGEDQQPAESWPQSSAQSPQMSPEQANWEQACAAHYGHLHPPAAAGRDSEMVLVPRALLSRYQALEWQDWRKRYSAWQNAYTAYYASCPWQQPDL